MGTGYPGTSQIKNKYFNGYPNGNGEKKNILLEYMYTIECRIPETLPAYNVLLLKQGTRMM